MVSVLWRTKRWRLRMSRPHHTLCWVSYILFEYIDPAEVGADISLRVGAIAFVPNFDFFFSVGARRRRMEWLQWIVTVKMSGKQTSAADISARITGKMPEYGHVATTIIEFDEQVPVCEWMTSERTIISSHEHKQRTSTSCFFSHGPLRLTSNSINPWISLNEYGNLLYCSAMSLYLDGHSADSIETDAINRLQAKQRWRGQHFFRIRVDRRQYSMQMTKRKLAAVVRCTEESVTSACAPSLVLLHRMQVHASVPSSCPLRKRRLKPKRKLRWRHRNRQEVCITGRTTEQKQKLSTRRQIDLEEQRP